MCERAGECEVSALGSAPGSADALWWSGVGVRPAMPAETAVAS